MPPEPSAPELVSSQAEQVPAQPTPVAPFIPQQQSADEGYSSPGWSWGAFMQGPYFLMAIKNYALLWVYVLLIVPVINIIVGIGFAVYLGMKGRELAAVSPMFANKEQYIGFMKAIDHAGKIMFFVTIVLIAIAFVFSGIVMSSLGGARERAADAKLRQEEALFKAERVYEEYPGDRLE